MGDACFNMARILRRKLQDGRATNPRLSEHLTEIHDMLENIMQFTVEVLESDERTQNMILHSHDLEKALNIKYKFLVAENLKDLNNNVYPYQDSVYYLDIIDEYERLGDYAVNVVEAYVRQEK